MTSHKKKTRENGLFEFEGSYQRQALRDAALQTAEDHFSKILPPNRTLNTQPTLQPKFRIFSSNTHSIGA